MSDPTPEQKRAVYERYARRYAQRTEGYERFLGVDYDRFQEALPGPRVLDLGCGPGRDGAEFARRGMKPLCLDMSAEMLTICQEKGLATIKQDMEQLELPAASRDGIWSYTSLTTIPKAKVWTILDRVANVLVPNGVLFLGLIEGDGEYWKPADEKYAVPRFISRYRHIEVKAQLDKRFELQAFSRIDSEQTGRNTYLHFLAVKR
jgi:SAM-dependent methyltransferase